MQVEEVWITIKKPQIGAKSRTFRPNSLEGTAKSF